MVLKKPLTFEEQVLKLEEHGMNISDREIATNILKRINYYKLTGYALQFRMEEDTFFYKPETDFMNVYKIYCFDEKMRGILRDYLEKLEIYYRTQISYGFSILKCNEEPHNQHYDSDSFYDKNNYTKVMENFKREQNYYKDSNIVKHHKEKYNDEMPLWVAVELMSFSTLSKLYGCMYNKEADLIATNVNSTQNILRNRLKCFSILRNKCAHGSRLYNTVLNPPIKLSPFFLRKYSDVINDTLYAYIVAIVKSLPNKDDRIEFVSRIKDVIENYKNEINLKLIGFPENYDEILLESI